MVVILTWLLHSVIIQISIVLFAAPFWIWYRVSRGDAAKHTSHSLGEHIEMFFSSSQMNYLVFCWAATEAIVWFIIPEFLLALIIFMRIRQRASLLVWDLVGTAVGTIFAVIISFSPTDLVRIPYITSGMIMQVHDWYQHFGIWALAFQPFSGIPYKVFTALASGNGIHLVIFVLVGTLVRIGRYIVIYLIFSGLYSVMHRFVFRKYIAIFVVSCMIFSFALLKVVNNYGPTYEVQPSTTLVARILEITHIH